MVRTDLIFSGTVVQITDLRKGQRTFSGGDSIQYLFAIREVWKGAVKDTVTVNSARDGAACGYQFQLNQSYVVFAGERKGAFRTGICGNTAPLERAATRLALLASLPKRGAPIEVDRAIIQSFVTSTQAPSETIRVAAAESLGYMQKAPELAVPALLELFHRGGTKEREAATGALAANYDSTTAIAFLMTAFEDRDPAVRAKALSSFWKVARTQPEIWSEQCLVGLGDPSPSVRTAAIRLLRHQSLDHELLISRLLEAIEDTSASVRAAAANAMTSAASETACVRPLIRAAHDPDPDVALAAIGSLVYMRRYSDCGEPCESVLVEMVSDPNPQVSHAAYMMILGAGSEAAVRRTFQAGITNPDLELRRRALHHTLYHYEGRPEAVPILVQSLGDTSSVIRAEALSALDEGTCPVGERTFWIADSGAREDLITALLANARKGQPDGNRYSALEILDRLSLVKESLSVFREAAQDGHNESIREFARRTLRASGIDPDVDDK